MSEDVLHRVRRQTLNPTLQMTAEIYNETLIMIEDMCLLMANKVLSVLFGNDSTKLSYARCIKPRVAKRTTVRH